MAKSGEQMKIINRLLSNVNVTCFVFWVVFCCAILLSFWVWISNEVLQGTVHSTQHQVLFTSKSSRAPNKFLMSLAETVARRACEINAYQCALQKYSIHSVLFRTAFPSIWFNNETSVQRTRVGLKLVFPSSVCQVWIYLKNCNTMLNC